MDEVANLFVRDFKGDCIHAGLNYPGSWHDSRLAASSGLYSPMLTDYTQAGFAILSDSDFPRTAAELEGKIV